MTKRALCLSGGGSKGAWQVGSIKALLESGRTWDSVHGISVGALNASFLSLYSPEQQLENFFKLEDLWRGIVSSNNIYKPWLPYKIPNYIASMIMGSINSGAPLKQLFESIWSDELFLESSTLLTVGCVSITDGKYEVFDNSNPEIKKYILASSHLPVVFPPILINQTQWVDGGIRYQIPILEAIKEKPDEIDVIVTAPLISNLPALKNYIVTAPGAALRASEILSEQVYSNDFFAVLKAKKHHEQEAQTFLGQTKYRKSMKPRSFVHPKINLYFPETYQPVHSMVFDPKVISSSISLGYSETMKKFKK